MIRTPTEYYTSGISAIVNEPISMSEVATENAYSEWLFLAIALEIANFPCKQRRAMLIDLAKTECILMNILRHSRPHF